MWKRTPYLKTPLQQGEGTMPKYIVYCLLGNIFCSIWVSDELNTQQPPLLPAYYIVNTHSRHLLGEHWLAITLEEGGKAIFFWLFWIFYYNHQLQHEVFHHVFNTVCITYARELEGCLKKCSISLHRQCDKELCYGGRICWKKQQFNAASCMRSCNQLSRLLQLFKDCYRLWDAS